jgi:chromosome segregation ATPase
MDIERTMQFIVEQQAHLTASTQKHDEQIAALTASVQKHDEHIGTLTNLLGRLAQAEIRLVERMEKVESDQQEMRTAMTRLFERMDRFIQGLEGNGHKQR